jgi:hypothetical protein
MVGAQPVCWSGFRVSEPSGSEAAKPPDRKHPRWSGSRSSTIHACRGPARFALVMRELRATLGPQSRPQASRAVTRVSVSGLRARPDPPRDLLPSWTSPACLPNCLPIGSIWTDQSSTQADAQHAQVDFHERPALGWHGSGQVRTPGVPPRRTGTDSTPRHAPTSKRRSGSYGWVLGLRNEKVRGSSPLSSTIQAPCQAAFVIILEVFWLLGLTPA